MIMWGCIDLFCIFCCGLWIKLRSKWSLDFCDGSMRCVCFIIIFLIVDFIVNDIIVIVLFIV